MDRKDFIKNCGMACLGFGTVTTVLQSCSVPRTLTGKIEHDDLVIPLRAFETMASNQLHYKKYIVINNEQLKFPICVFREETNVYTAVWLQCSHQGAELQVFGDKLQCPAHGSEFNSKGMVTGGPANNNLRTFPVTVAKNNLLISLKAI